MGKELRLLITFYLLAIIQFCFGNDSTSAKFEPLPITIHSITTENGLSHNQIHDILKDHEGYIWLATKNGLNRFDSYEFKVYKHSVKDTNSIGDNKVWCLLEDSQNRLWIGTNQGGLNLFDRQTGYFEKFIHNPDDEYSISQSGVTSMIEDHKGKLWVGTFWGLNQFDPETEKFKSYYFAEDDPASIPDNYITSLMEDDQHQIWVGTKSGLAVFNRETQKFKNYTHEAGDNTSLAGNFIRDIFQDSEKKIWIATEGGGVSMYRSAHDNFKNFTSTTSNKRTLTSNIVRTITEDQKGNIWFGTDGGGLNIYNKRLGEFKRLHAKNDSDFCNSAIYDIYFDQHGVTWLARYGKGLINFNRNKKSFRSYKNFVVNDSIYNSSSVLAIVKDQNENIWLGTGNSGLFRFNPKSKSFTQFHERGSDNAFLADHPIKSLMVDNNNNLWAGTYAGGLHKINLEYRHVTHFYHDPKRETSLSNNNIWALYQDSESRIWVGTLEKGLDEYIPETKKFIHHSVDYTSDSSISSNTISVIYEDSKNRLWVGTEGGGLNLMNKKSRTFRKYQHYIDDTVGITNNEVNAIFEDSNNRLWVGTNGGGLHLYNKTKDRFDKFEIKAEKYDAIYGILEDPSGNLWMSSNNGLYVLSPDTRYLKTYDVYDGLQGNQYNYNAQITASDGIFYFGGVNGFDHFDPKNIKQDTSQSKIVIADFYLFHKQSSKLTDDGLGTQVINKTKKIVLNPSQYVFGFKYAALDYSLPKNNKYAFKLEGFDEEWNYVGNTREATYTNIPPGEYEFKVKATNNDGVWSSTPLEIKVIILPPWWDIIWVQILLALLITASIFLIIRLRTRMLVNKKQTLENEVKKRVHQIEHQKLEIEEKNEELQQQNEKIWKSHEHIQHQNDELKAKNEIILHQGKQVKEKSALLEKAHEEIKIANNELKRVNADLERMVDIRTSELKEAMKKLIKSDEELNTFLYRSSHDLRGPITTLLGLTRLAQKENKDPQISPYFEKIKNSCHNMMKVLKKLSETNVVFKSKRVASKINVKEIVQHIELDLNQFDQHQEVRKEFNANIDHDIYSDELLLKIIIYNLMENSIIYRSIDDPYVKLELNANREALEIVVTDNGLGIRDDIIPHIYKMFYRGSEHSTGNGLGLYLVQKSVELLNGKIHLESEEYKFTKFVVTIPNEQKDSVKKLDEIYMEKHSL